MDMMAGLAVMLLVVATAGAIYAFVNDIPGGPDRKKKGDD